MNDNNAPHYTELPIAQLEENRGQIDGLPANPRNIQPDKLAKLKRSILDNPEMLQLRGILVYPHGDKYIVIGGNMRLRAMVELGMTSAPCVVIPSHVTADKLRAYTILDNSSMGEWDWQALQLEWDTAQLDDWGIDLPDWEEELASTDGTLEMTSDKTESTVSLNRMNVGDYVILYTDEEKAHLIESIERYIEKYGITTGYIRHLVESERDL
ncbi:ParB/RepB/Spo0J family partition protein [Porphyromonas vaginalis]|uniref:ParB/RepB/Spo0J family partition protein n=1 Tax=Porphyromonas vaginalis TaxID=3044325 RepID=UPI002618B7A2|nr:ParB N-terminal domain-containing protein [Porphyromonas vaginalis]